MRARVNAEATAIKQPKLHMHSHTSASDRIGTWIYVIKGSSSISYTSRAVIQKCWPRPGPPCYGKTPHEYSNVAKFPPRKYFFLQGVYKSGISGKFGNSTDFLRAARKYWNSVEISQGNPEFYSFLAQFKRGIQIFEIFRISSNGGTEKVLNFSLEEVLNFSGMYCKSTDF